VDTSAPIPGRLTCFRLQFAGYPEISTLGYSRFRRPYWGFQSTVHRDISLVQSNFPDVNLRKNAPSLIVFIWMGVFGNAAIYQIINNSSNIDEVVSGNFAIALFSLYDIYPGSQQLSILSLILIITFFVTSSDSGSLVASMLSSKSQTDINDSSPLVSRVTWAILLGVVAAVLMFAGGLTALQTSVIITGVPFAIIIVFACIKLHRSLEEDLKS
jgi:choline-glycine betaine transporter